MYHCSSLLGRSSESASQEKREEPKTRIVEDTLGRKGEVPEEPKRVVGIGAGGLRLIVFAGGTDLPVRIEDFEKKDQKKPYVIAHEELPSIGPKHGADPELMAEVRPDLIIGAQLITYPSSQFRQSPLRREAPYRNGKERAGRPGRIYSPADCGPLSYACF